MSLANKTKTALDESRMLMLGAQILLGFEFQAPFQNAFSTLSSQEKTLELVILALMICVTGLLVLLPSSYHRLALSGEASSRLLGLVDRVMVITLGLFALAMGGALGLAAARITGASFAMWFGVATSMLTLGIWLGPGFIRRRKAKMAYVGREDACRGEDRLRAHRGTPSYCPAPKPSWGFSSPLYSRQHLQTCPRV
jgi:hypothetical protein